MIDKTMLRIKLLEEFDSLLSSVNALCAAVRHDTALPVWVSRTVQEADEGLAMRVKAVHLYHTLWYEDGQDGRETLTCPGIIGASEATLSAARVCNVVKNNFKEAVLSLKALSKADTNSLMMDLQRRNEEVAISMKRIGAARLNLKQAYRRIPVLDRRPQKIGFTWSRQGRTIQRTSVAEARRLLERRSDSQQLRMELQRLAQISEDEVLARIRGVCPHLRANLVFENPDGTDGAARRLIQAPLPILVPLKPGQSLPDFVPIAPQPSGSLRLQRSDVRIEEEPFLPSIRIHRYRDRYRYQSSKLE